MARPVLGEVTRGLRTALRFHVLTAEVSRRAHDSIPLLIGFEHEALLVRWRCSRWRPCWPYAVASGCLRLPAGRRLAARCNAPLSPIGNGPKSRQQTLPAGAERPGLTRRLAGSAPGHQAQGQTGQQQ